MATLQQDVQSWRTSASGQNADGSLLSKLSIGGTLYHVKDPAVEELAKLVEGRLSELEGKTWTAVSKDANAAKFATSVTQGTDGAITVTYGTIRDTALADTSTTNQVVKGIAQTVDGVVTATMGQVAAGEVSFSETNWTATDAKAAILEALSKAIGESTDASTDNTIYGAKAYALDLVNNLAGANWSDNAKKVQEIIEELENSENGNAWATAIDKLAGLNINYTQAEADTHNAGLTGAISTETTLTADQAAALNAIPGVSVTYEAGNQPNAEDAAKYNATLTGAWSTSTVKTPQTVKQYVDAAVANANSSANDAIAALDAVVRGNLDNSDEVSTGHKVGVKVTEVDGVITDVTVVEDDIASAQALEDLADTVEEHSEVTAAALTDLDSRLTSVETNVGDIDLSTKADKDEFTTATINNWSANYNANNEQLTWTNTETSVYVPVNDSNNEEEEPEP